MTEQQDTKPKSNKNNPLWFIGVIGLFLVTKGKSLLLLLSKFAGPLISMVVTIGAYALLSPIEFAIGFVLLILVHEMGHVLAAKHKGLPVSAPLFIPFLGALIMMKRNPKDAETEAYIAIGGPIVGSIGALVVYIAGVLFNIPLFFALAYVGFLINLFNLLPIHPLDGGRIATAVSRWLWVAGLIGGLVLIIMWRSPLLFIIWALFAWNLYQKYFRYRGRGKPHEVKAMYEVEIEQLGLPAWYLAGEQHARELPFTTYSKLSGEQIVRFYWETLSFEGELELPMQGIVKKVQLINSERFSEAEVEKLRVQVKVDYEKYENERYYEVSSSVRWRYGTAYAGLALFLIAMMWNIQSMGLDAPVR